MVYLKHYAIRHSKHCALTCRDIKYTITTIYSDYVNEHLPGSKHAEGKSGEVLPNFEEINKLHTKPDHAVPVFVSNAPGCVE